MVAHHLRCQALDALDEREFLAQIFLGSERTCVVAADLGARVAQGVDGVAHTVDETRAVEGLLVENLAQVGCDLVLVLPIGDMCTDVLVHGHDLGVGAAVARALERADGRGVGGIRIGGRGGQYAAGKRGVVAAAVLGMQHEHHVEQHGFVAGECHAAAQHLQDGLGGGETGRGMRYMNLGAAALGDRGHMREGGDAGETGEHGDGDIDFVLGCNGVGLGVEGVEQQHGALKHIHDARRHRGHGELADVFVAQVPKSTQTSAKTVKLFLGGQRARNEQIGDLFVAVAVLGLGVVDQILDAVATKREFALIGHDLTVDLVVAVHIRDASEARDHARAVGIAQAALDIVLDKQVLVIRVGRQAVVEVFAFGRNLTARLVIQNQAAQVIVEAVVDFLGVVGHARSSPGRIGVTCMGMRASGYPQRLARYRRYIKLKTSSRWMDTLTPESSPASASAFCSSAKSSLDSAVSASMVMVKMSSIMDCVMSRMSTLASPRTRVTPATMPGRFLPRTVMTIREDEISAMGNPFA